MQFLAQNEVEQVSGGDVNWGELGAGAALVGLGVAIAATPVGWLGMAAAGAASLGGGYAIGDSFSGELERFYFW